MSDDLLKLAFIGAGMVSGPYCNAVRSNASISFAGVYDPIGARAQAIVEQLQGRTYASEEELLSDASIEAVVVMNPTSLHVETAKRCLQAGKHVLLEKPVAESVCDIDDLQRIANGANRVCMPAHNYIYAPVLQRAKRLIQEGKLGDIASLWILYNVFHSEELAKRYGGVLRVICVHHAYSLLYLLGRPQFVSATTSCVHYQELTCEDQVMITCKMRGGAIANLWASFAANDPTSDPWTVIYKILGTQGGLNHTWNDAQFEDSRGPGWGMPNYLESFSNELDFFARHAVKGRPPLSTLQDARDAISIIEAAEKSAETSEGAIEVSYDNVP